METPAPSETLSPNSPVPSKENQKPAPKLLTYLLVILGLILVGGVVFGGYLYMYGSSSRSSNCQEYRSDSKGGCIVSPSATLTENPDDTANWKTYSNSKYGFSIEYLVSNPNFKPVEEVVKGVDHIYLGSSDVYVLSRKSKALSSSGEDSILGVSISSLQQLELGKSTIREDKINDGTVVTITYERLADVKISEQSWERINITNTYEMHGVYEYYLLNKGDLTYIISDSHQPPNTRSVSDHQHRLNSFKFTDSSSITPTTTSTTGNDCKISGCSGQLCSDEQVISTCEWKEEYSCYQNAKCERQSSGQCGWTQTAELKRCIAESK